MRRALLAVALALLGACAAKAPRVPPTAVQAPSTPRTFVAADGSFRVTFPTSAVEVVADHPGKAAEEHGAKARIARGMVVDQYEATYSDVAEVDRVLSLDALLDGLAEQGSIRFDARRAVRSGSIDGREIDVFAGDHLERWRYFKLDNRVFIIGVVTTDRGFPSSAAAFLDSFAVVGAVPRGIRSLPAGMDVRLPNDDWQLGSTTSGEDGCMQKTFARTSRATPSTDPISLFFVCARALPPDATLAGFEAVQSQRDRYVRDAPFAPGQDWPLGFTDAVGFRAHMDGPIKKRAFVFYTVENRVGFTLAVEAPEADFARLEPEFRQLLGSIRPPGPAAPSARSR
jgi:hypothetical protein